MPQEFKSPSKVGMIGVAAVIALVVALPVKYARGQDNAGKSSTRPAAGAEDVKLNGATLAKLDRVLPAVKFDGVAFADVLDFLQDVSGTKIVAPWDKLKAAGIDKNKAVTLNVRNEKFSDVLSVLLIKAAGKPGVLKYGVEHGNIVIVVAAAGPTTKAK
jgi:hypothetical protein